MVSGEGVEFCDVVQHTHVVLHACLLRAAGW